MRRSIGIPLAIGITLLLLVLALGVGWPLLVVSEERAIAPGLTTGDWLLLVLGVLCCALISVGLLWLCLWLVREMRLNQRQQAFLDAVTHEMKTPLASLRLYLDTLQRREVEPERQRLFLAGMEQDLERLHRTVDQVLEAARAEEGSRARVRARVELRELLWECAEEVRREHALPAESLHLDLDAATTVRGDRAELLLVFRNLLENAVQYSDDPVEIRVRATPRGDDRVDVEISDRGIGIPARELRKIFQRFYRVGRDVQRRAAGLGLGLFIVRNLVRRQGGRVVARSEGAGAGSRFVVTLRAMRPAHTGSP